MFKESKIKITRIVRYYLVILLSLLFFTDCVSKKNENEANASMNSSGMFSKEANSSNHEELEYRNIRGINCMSFRANHEIWLTTSKTGKLVYVDFDGTSAIKEVNGDIACVSFVNEESGWYLEVNGGVWATNDKGLTWKRTFVSDEISAPEKLYFLNPSDGIIMDALSLLLTDDGGKSWRTSMSYLKNPLEGQPGDFFFIDKNTGWLCDAGDVNGNVYSTKDGGTNWKIKRVAKHGQYNCRLFFIDSETGWYSNGKNRIYKTRNGATTWTRTYIIPKGFVVNSMFWFNETVGLLSGYQEDSKAPGAMYGKGALIKTMDGGKTWEPVQINSDSPFFDKLLFKNNLEGVLATRDEVFATSDGGNEWKRIFSLSKIEN